MAAVATKTSIPPGLDPRVLIRIVEEGYGPGAWHGPDLKAALADVPEAAAFWRPSPGRHSIAEVALHHAYCTRDARGRILDETPEPFLLEGDDWFALPDPHRLTWDQIRSAVDAEQRRLTAALEAPSRGGLSEAERFDLALGIACHAIYHAGQIQLLKTLAEEAGLPVA